MEITIEKTGDLKITKTMYGIDGVTATMELTFDNNAARDRYNDNDNDIMYTGMMMYRKVLSLNKK